MEAERFVSKWGHHRFSNQTNTSLLSTWPVGGKTVSEILIKWGNSYRTQLIMICRCQNGGHLVSVSVLMAYSIFLIHLHIPWALTTLLSITAYKYNSILFENQHFPWRKPMMTSSNENIFRVTDHLCGEFTGPGEFPTQRPVTRSFDVYFDLRPNKWLSKQSWGWWFETLSCSLWRHRNAYRTRS